jgi:hypothetical protein
MVFSTIGEASKRLGDSILLTFGDGIGPQRASSDGAIRSVFNHDGGSFRQCSGCKDCSSDGGVGGGSSSKRWTDARDFDSMAQRWRRRW